MDEELAGITQLKDEVAEELADESEGTETVESIEHDIGAVKLYEVKKERSMSGNSAPVESF